MASGAVSGSNEPARRISAVALVGAPTALRAIGPMFETGSAAETPPAPTMPAASAAHIERDRMERLYVTMSFPCFETQRYGDSNPLVNNPSSGAAPIVKLGDAPNAWNSATRTSVSRRGKSP